MLTLIAESKTMTACNDHVTRESYGRHCPTGDDKAFNIMARIASMSPREVSERSGLSLSMAMKLHRMALEFPDKSTGQHAIEAFTGVVFKALDYKTLTDGDRSIFCHNVRIISSLYGWLRPDDIIKAYRLDYTTPLSHIDNAMSTYWRDQVSVNLVRELQASGSKAVLNLLPADAAKCVDWKLVKRFAKVWKVDFKELKDGGKFVTPNAGRLKTMRGHLLREITERHIEHPDELLTLSTPLLLPMGTPEYPDHVAFCI